MKHHTHRLAFLPLLALLAAPILLRAQQPTPAPTPPASLSLDVPSGASATPAPPSVAQRQAALVLQLGRDSRAGIANLKRSFEVSQATMAGGTPASLGLTRAQVEAALGPAGMAEMHRRAYVTLSAIYALSPDDPWLRSASIRPLFELLVLPPPTP